MPRVQLDCAGVRCNGSFQLLQVGQGYAALEVRIYVLRLTGDHVIVVAARRCVLAFVRGVRRNVSGACVDSLLNLC